MAIGRLGHGGIAAAFAEACEVERPGVEAARIPVIEPGTAAEIEADGQRRGKSGAMDVKDRRRTGQGLATDEERWARPRCRDPYGLLGPAPEIGTFRRPTFRRRPKRDANPDRYRAPVRCESASRPRSDRRRLPQWPAPWRV